MISDITRRAIVLCCEAVSILLCTVLGTSPAGPRRPTAPIFTRRTAPFAMRLWPVVNSGYAYFNEIPGNVLLAFGVD
jgi:hypothetical protein